MRALVQRVSRASVTVEGEVFGEIGSGLLVLACAMAGDPPEAVSRLASKIARLRIFPDDEGRMNRSLLDAGGEALVVSQFTLAADTSRGNRPGFSSAAPPEDGEERVAALAAEIRAFGVRVAEGRFGADMKVDLTNDGPITIWLDTVP